MSLTTDSSERREARWPITLGGLYYGVLPKASHGELCPSPFVVIDLEPAPTQRAGIYQRAVRWVSCTASLWWAISHDNGETTSNAASETNKQHRSNDSASNLRRLETDRPRPIQDVSIIN